MALGSSSSSHVERYFRKDGMSVRKTALLKMCVLICHAHVWCTFPIPQNQGSGLLEISSYVPPVTFYIPPPWYHPIKKEIKPETLVLGIITD